MKNLFRQGLKRIVATERRARGPREAKVISVASLKGGVGKTTTSVNLASALARFHQQRVLLIDLDPQGHVGTSLRTQILQGGGKLSQVLTRDALEITRTYYDVIVIDCPPNLGNLTLNALVASDYLLVPCDLSPLALRGVDSLLGHAQQVGARLNPGLDLLGVVITRHDRRPPSMNEAVLTSLQANYGESLMPTRIGISTSLSRAQHMGAEIFEHD